jgi:hypothetical protein
MASRSTARWASPSNTNDHAGGRTMRLQGQTDRRGIVLVVVVLLLIAIAIAAYLLFLAPPA